MHHPNESPLSLVVTSLHPGRELPARAWANRRAAGCGMGVVKGFDVEWGTERYRKNQKTFEKGRICFS